MSRYIWKVVTGFLVVIACIGIVNAYAQETTIRIQHYTHQGCEIGGQRILPAFADIGLVATFRFPSGEQQCLDAVKRMKIGCTKATFFQSTDPNGHPWQPGGKDPRCLELFKKEISRCIEHYEGQMPKCKDPQGIQNTDLHGPEATSTHVRNEKRDRRNLIHNLVRKHESRKRKLEKGTVAAWQRQNVPNRALQQAALQHSAANLLSSLTGRKWANRKSARGGDLKCRAIAEQIAENLRSTRKKFSGSCNAGREQLRMLTYAKNNLSRNGCYSGEYDQTISETRNYIAQVC